MNRKQRVFLGHCAWYFLWLGAALQGCGGGGSSGSPADGGAIPAPPVPAPLIAPSITSQPQSQTVTEGTSVSFSVSAAGSAPLAFQWQRNGASIAGATSSTFTLGAVQAVDDRTLFDVKVSNAAGTAASAAATLGVDLSIGSNLSLLAGTISSVVSASSDGVGDKATFGRITGMTVDKLGNVYVTEVFLVRKITPAGVVSTIAGQVPPVGVPLPDSALYADGPGPLARFWGIRGVAVDDAGVLYVADGFNGAIRKITSDGVVSTFAGGPFVRGNADGSLAQASFSYPAGIVLDRNGSLYVLDALGNGGCMDGGPDGSATTFTGYSVRKIMDGSVKTVPGSVIGNAQYGTGLLYFGGGLALDAQGNLFMSLAPTQKGFVLGVGCGSPYALGAGYVQKITPAGQVTIVAGTSEFGTAGAADGSGAAARFRTPQSIAMAADGRFYVADTDNRAIRRLTADGAVSTVVGRLPTSTTTTATLTLGPLPGELMFTDTVAAGPDGTLYLATGSSGRRVVLRTTRR